MKAVLLIGCLVSLLAAPPQPRAAAITVFAGARLIAGDGGAPLEDSAFVVENDRITRVGRKSDVPAPPGATRVDLTGKTEILGLDALGMVAPGKSADFVVLDANPLDDITNTRTIAEVYLSGRKVDRVRLRADFATAGRGNR